jgi:hypothetical protein
MRQTAICVLSALAGAATMLALRPAERTVEPHSNVEVSRRLERIEAEVLRLNMVSRCERATVARETPVATPATVASSAAAAPAEPPEPSTEQLAAARDSSRVIEAALSSGVWRDTDREHWQSLAPQLDSRTRAALMEKLVVALNKGELRPNTSGPPL